MKLQEKSLAALHHKIGECQACPRLVAWREKVAHQRRPAFQDQTYWGRPLAGFGDEQAELLVVGLAPAAHGGNRTGRVFTGDRSGDWLYRALHRAGFANQAQSVDRDDGLELQNAFVSVCVRCAPPQNKPTPQERDNCLPLLAEEMFLLPNLRVLVVLGAFALDGILRTLAAQYLRPAKKPKFGHGAEIELGRYTILCSYHPSQQNTFTGVLTEKMFDDIFARAKKLLNRRAKPR